MLSPRFNSILSLVLLQVSFLPKLPSALGAYLSNSNGTVMASMPAYPLSFSNTTFFLDRVPLYVISNAEAANSCEVKGFPSQWPFVVLVHEKTTCGNWEKMVNLCDRKGCLGVIFAPLNNPVLAGSASHIARITTSTSHTPVLNMEAFPGPQLEWLLREGTSHPGAVLISVRSDEYNEGASVLSSWKYRSIGFLFALHGIANSVAVLCKLLVKILDLRDGKMNQTNSHSLKRRRFGLPAIYIWPPLFMLLPEFITGVLFATFWINIMLFRAQGISWSLFRICLGTIYPFTFLSTVTTAFAFSKITLQNKYRQQRSWAHKVAGSLFLQIVLWVVALTDITHTIYSSITNNEIFGASFITALYTIMQFFCSLYFIVGGNKMVKLLSKGSSSSKLQHAQTLQFANRVRFSGNAMLVLWASLGMLAVSVATFQSSKSFWYPLILSTGSARWVNSAQIRTVVVRRQNRMNAKPIKLVQVMPPVLGLRVVPSNTTYNQNPTQCNLRDLPAPTETRHTFSSH